MSFPSAVVLSLASARIALGRSNEFPLSKFVSDGFDVIQAVVLMRYGSFVCESVAGLPSLVD
jgi:hypothetical protein